MQTYPVRASHRGNLQPSELERIARSAFEEAQVDGTAVRAKFGAIRELTARASGRELAVDLAMDPKVPAEVAAETVRRYNRFLEEATGFSSKERAKRLRKSASAPGSGA